MSKHIRLRCPVCGMLTWQSRLDGDHEFELVVQEIKGKGKGKGFSNRYYSPENAKGVWLIKLALIEKLESVLAVLKQELKAEKHEIWREHFYAGEYAEASQVSSKYHADFGEMFVSVDGLLEGENIQVVLVPGKTTTQVPLSVATPGVSELFIQGNVESEQDDVVGIVMTEQGVPVTLSGFNLFAKSTTGSTLSKGREAGGGKTQSRKGNENEESKSESVWESE